MGELDRYAFSGHSTLMGKRTNEWQDTAYILQRFGKRLKPARQKYRGFVQQGMDIEQVARRVAQIMDMSIKEVWSRGKYRRIVKARSLLCYWAVRELGISMASLSRRLHISSAAVSQSVQRGENLAKENHYHLIHKTLNIKNVPYCLIALIAIQVR
jgi:lambda repressor-like predicted transcriptional regulator